MRWSTHISLVTLLALALLLPLPAHANKDGDTTAQHSRPDDGADDESGQKMTIDPAAVRDTIASLLREGAAGAVTDDQKDDGYAEAAQEYLEHLQTIMTNVKSASEVYVREQLADLETLNSFLSALEAASAKCRSLLRTPRARQLLAHLVKGPGRELLWPLLPPLEDPADAAAAPRPPSYAGSQLATRVTETAAELRRFLGKVSASLTDDLRRHAGELPAGPVRDYLDSVLDRVLELEGRETRFNVEYPSVAEGGGMAEPKISRVPDDEAMQQQQTTSPGSSDDGGRGLFDQVLGRLAAASVIARLAESGAAGAAARIAELRGRRYQPPGMKVILEIAEDCSSL